MSEKHIAEPWHYRPNRNDDWGVIRDSNKEYMVARAVDYRHESDDECRRLGVDPYEANAQRIVECVNACAGQSIEHVKLATAHRDAVMLWETSMMDVIGEDGVGSVSLAILALKDERDLLKKKVAFYEEQNAQFNNTVSELQSQIDDDTFSLSEVKRLKSELDLCKSCVTELRNDKKGMEDLIEKMRFYTGLNTSALKEMNNEGGGGL